MLYSGMRLEEYIDSYKSTRFDWKDMNCVHFAGRWVEVSELFDPLAGIDMPDGKAGVAALVDVHGGIEGWVSEALSRQIRPAALAHTGDIVCINGSEGSWALGICVGRYAAFLEESGGLVYARMSTVSSSWHVVQNKAPK